MNLLERINTLEFKQERLKQISEQLAVMSEQAAKDAEGIVIATDDDKEIAMYIIKDIKDVNKELESRRKYLVDPHNKTVKEINEFFKSHIQKFEKSDGILRNKVLAYERELERKRLDQERLAREAEEKAIQEAEELAEKETPTVEDVKRFDAAHEEGVVAQQKVEELQRDKTQHFEGVKSTTKKVWTFEIIEKDEVPLEYLEVNETAVRCAIRIGIRNIPGIKIYQKETLAVS